MPLTARAAPGAVIVMLLVAVKVNGTALASTTCTTKDELPAAVGVPEITPVAALKARPAGRDPPARLNVKGAVPPEAVSVVEYATPTWPAGGVPESTGSGFTVMATVFVLCVPGIEPTRDVCICVVVAGAVKVTGFPVDADNEPQVGPLQLGPLRVQVRGSVSESVAEIAIDCPASSVRALALVLTMPPPPG